LAARELLELVDVTDVGLGLGVGVGSIHGGHSDDFANVAIVEA